MAYSSAEAKLMFHVYPDGLQLCRSGVKGRRSLHLFHQQTGGGGVGRAPIECLFPGLQRLRDSPKRAGLVGNNAGPLPLLHGSSPPSRSPAFFPETRPFLPKRSGPFLLVVMMAAMATLVVCLIEIHADVPPQRDFDLQRFGGKWFRVGLADDSASFLPYRDRLKISMGTITPMPNGNANLTMWGLSPSGCQSKAYVYEKTTTPGLFVYFSTRHNRMKDITVVETNYSEYALVLKHKKMDREYSQVALYGRHPRLRPALLQRFRDFAASRGFSRDSVVTPSPPADNCPRLHGR